MVIALLTLMSSGVSPSPAGPPLYYGRMGDMVTIAVDGPDGGEVSEGDEIVVLAGGAPLGAQLRVQGGQARLLVPDVRARTILDLRCPARNNEATAQVAAYPWPSQLWDEKKITVCALGAPPWFQQWSAAVGIEVTAFSDADVLRRTVPQRDSATLIVMGRDAPFGRPREALEFASACAANVLVLEAGWYTRPVDEPTTLRLNTDRPPLPALGAWTWRELPPFTYRWAPELSWINRAAISHADGPVLLEHFVLPEESRTLVAGYVPWDQWVGRNDSADAFLAALIRETARAEPPEPLASEIAIVPEDLSWPDPLRPVSSRVRRTAKFSTGAGGLWVVDVRGEAPVALTARRINELLDSKATHPVLILGDDPILQSVRGLPRPDAWKKERAELIWLPADVLPPSQAEQETLMRILTDYRIPIVEQEENVP